MLEKKIICRKDTTFREHLDPKKLLGMFFIYRDLIVKFSQKDIKDRYQGTFFGFLWSFLNPLCLLAVYIFIFGFVLKIRWGGGHDSQLEYALAIMCGFTIFNIFADVVRSSPRIIFDHSANLKNFRFPIEVVPIAYLISNMVQAMAACFLIVVCAIVFFSLPPTFIYLIPLVFIPISAITLGMSWALAAIGVHLRDVYHTISILVQMLFFVSGLFHPLSAVPEKYLFFFRLNPFVNILEDARRIMLWNLLPDWPWYIYSLTVSLIVMQLGYALFMKMKSGFVDVI